MLSQFERFKNQAVMGAQALSASTLLFCLSANVHPKNEEVVPSDELTYTLGTKQRVKIYRDMNRVSVPIFKRILKVSKEPGNTQGHRMARTFVNMIQNMATSEVSINPVAFFATIKDFESALIFKWSPVGSSAAWTTQNCYSEECYGLFQVDVKIEPAWNSQICLSKKEGGVLGLNEFQGGMDYCAAIFWWTEAGNGHKCSRLNIGGPNPCKVSGIEWTMEMVARGRAAYGQKIQTAGGWDSDQWAEMYENYADLVTHLERSRTGNLALSKEEAMKISARRFLESIGFQKALAKATLEDSKKASEKRSKKRRFIESSQKYTLNRYEAPELIEAVYQSLFKA